MKAVYGLADFKLETGFVRINRRNNRGSALLLSIFFLLILAFLADALMILCPTELQAARRERFQNQAYYLAEGGILEATEKIETEAANNPIGFDAAVTDPSFAPSLTKDDMQCRVSITGQGNAYNNKKVYLLVSTVTVDGRMIKEMQAVVRQETFADYGYFSDVEQPYLEYDGQYSSDRTLWWYDDWQISGLFHTNGDLYIRYHPSNSGSTSTFENRVSLSGEAKFENTYAPGCLQTYDQAVSTYPDLPQRVFNSRQMVTGKTIELPANTDRFLHLAWGGSGFCQSSNGVYVNANNPADSGMVIKGDVDLMRLTVEDDNPVMIIKQGSSGYKLLTHSNGTVDLTTGYVTNTNTFVTTAYSTTRSYANLGDNLGKRLVYCTGNINSLYGVNKSPTIIATATGKDIVITNELTQSSTPKGSEPSSPGDSLGLIGHNVRISENLVQNYPSDLYVYATIMALKDNSQGIGSKKIFSNLDRCSEQVPNGCFMADYSYLWAGPCYRKIKIYGSLIQSVRGQVGNASCGFGRDLFFDPYAADSLSAMFPQIGFDIVACGVTH